MKKRYVIGLICDILIICLSIVGVTFALVNQVIEAENLIYFLTTIGAIFAGAVSLLSIVLHLCTLKHKNDRVAKSLETIEYILKLIATTTMMFAFVIVVGYMQWFEQSFILIDDLWINVLLHYVLPLVMLVGFVFGTGDRKHRFALTLLGPILTIAFYIYIPILVVLDNVSVNAFHEYIAQYYWKGETYVMAILVVAFAIVAYLMSIALYFLNALSLKGHKQDIALNIEKNMDQVAEVPSTEMIKVEDKESVEEKPNQPEENDDINNDNAVKNESDTQENSKQSEVKKMNKTTAKKTQEKKAAKLATTKEKAAPKAEDKESVNYRIYHISYREKDRAWAVKYQKGQRAIKLFATQAEAIEYAKALAKNQDGSIRVHSTKGRIRKA